MRSQAQQGAVIEPAHPARVAAGANRVPLQQGIDIHEAGLARPGEEQAHGLHAGAAGQQLPEQVLAGGTQSIEDVAGLFEALLDAGFVQQLQNGTLGGRSEEHTSELQSLIRTSYAVFCLKKNTTTYSSTVLKRTLINIHNIHL